MASKMRKKSTPEDEGGDIQGERWEMVKQVHLDNNLSRHSSCVAFIYLFKKQSKLRGESKTKQRIEVEEKKWHVLTTGFFWRESFIPKSLTVSTGTL